MYYSDGKIGLPKNFNHKKKGVHNLMLQEFVIKKINDLDKKMSDILQESVSHVRKDMKREIGKLKKEIDSLTKITKKLSNPPKLTEEKKCD